MAAEQRFEVGDRIRVTMLDGLLERDYTVSAVTANGILYCRTGKDKPAFRIDPNVPSNVAKVEVVRRAGE